MTFLTPGLIFGLCGGILVLILIYKAVKIVPESQVYVIERFSKYQRTLKSGLNLITPFLDVVAHKISVREKQLAEFQVPGITRDNVEVKLAATVFYQIIDAGASIYRIQNIEAAIDTAATSIVRSAVGKFELDALQSSREAMNGEIATNLQEAATAWGIEITRTEITDVLVDEQTKDSQRQQLNAERERRAAIARAEGEKRSIELASEAKLFESKRDAEAMRISADANAYATRITAEANAEQTRLMAAAITENGDAAIQFELMKRQIQALADVAAAPSAKTVIMPTDLTNVLGSLQVLGCNLTDSLQQKRES
ncbi:MAG: SPFH domain-containing protein [Myxococcota bacterium]|nr:SPFH domain-containing protein [Myxococcota bacterium]